MSRRASAGGFADVPLQVQVNAAAAATLGVVAPVTAVAGHLVAVALAPTDAFGKAATWPGAVQFAVDDPDAGIPADLGPGSVGPGGVTQVMVRLFALGNRTLTLSAAHNLLASATVTVVAGDPAGYALLGPARVTAGVATTVTAQSVDSYGNPVPFRAAGLRLTSNDPLATLAGDASLAFADNGNKALGVTLRTAGAAQVVNLVNASGLTLAQATVPVDNAAASQVALALPARGKTAGVSFPVQATVRDVFGNLARVGMPALTLTSSDVGATLPSPRVLLAADAGVVTVPLTFAAVGTLSVTAALDGVVLPASAASAVVDRIDQVAIGATQTCARLRTGKVYCWGKNMFGELGTGAPTPLGVTSNDPGASPPTVDLGTGRTATQLVAGGYSTCVLRDDGKPTCWGCNNSVAGYFGLPPGGFLGFGDTTPRGYSTSSMGNGLPAIDLGTGAVTQSVARGFGTGCAVLVGGALKCWGYNAYGTLGLGDTVLRGNAAGQMGDALPAVDLGTGRTPVQVVLTGGPHGAACALLDDASVKCWGDNTFGELGLGDTTHRGTAAGQMGDALPAVDLGTGRTALSLGVGAGQVCAVLDDHALKCWGAGQMGILGQGDTANRGGAAGQMGDNLPPVNLGTGRTARAVAGGDRHTCALLDDATVKCWGDNTVGNLGLGDTTPRGATAASMGDALPPVSLPTGEVAVQIVVGGTQSCVLFASGRLACWGSSQDILGGTYTPPIGSAAGQMGDALAPILFW